MCSGLTLACGACVDSIANFSLPFLTLWIPVFLVWFVLYGLVEGRFFANLGRALVLFVLLAAQSLGSLLFPFAVASLWWLCRVLRISWQGPTCGRPRWWCRANGLVLVFMGLSILHGYGFRANDPARLIRIASYSGGAGRRAQEALIRLGPPALSHVVQGMLIADGLEWRRHHVRTTGVRIVEGITGRRFPEGAAEVLAWWAAEGEEWARNTRKTESWLGRAGD